MSDFSAFMKQNASLVENEKVVVSKRFLDKNKKPIPWEIKAISSELDETIRKDCTRKVFTGKRNQYTQEVDTDAYLARLCTACVVYPNLNDAALQDSYGVKSAEALIKVMLTAGEYIELKAKVAEINGFDVSMEELVDEAKN